VARRSAYLKLVFGDDFPLPKGYFIEDFFGHRMMTRLREDYDKWFPLYRSFAFASDRPPPLPAESCTRTSHACRLPKGVSICIARSELCSSVSLAQGFVCLHRSPKLCSSASLAQSCVHLYRLLKALFVCIARPSCVRLHRSPKAVFVLFTLQRRAFP
jgi:hypothetical protein